MKGLSLPGDRPLPVNLALQGGGAHGAFTWGVLDRLLEEPWLTLEGISGASAGAVNAAVLASGWLHGGRDGAREALRRFWEHIGGSGPHASPLDYLLSGWNRDASPRNKLLRSLTRVASPYQLNPGGINPLHRLLDRFVDFAAIRAADKPRLFVAATNVHSAKLRILRNAELNADAVMASACLPLLFQAVELDGEYYWDGGYAANPPLFPLLTECGGRDLLLVQLNRAWESQVPTSVSSIVNRMNEISFHSNLLRELQMLALLKREAKRHWLPAGAMERRVRRLHFHQIGIEDAAAGAGHSSPANVEWPFLKHLHEQGQIRAEDWLSRHGADLGRRSSFDIESFL